MKEMLSKIMKRAWELKKQDSRNIFALCLKMAWAEAKKGATKSTCVKEYLLSRGLKVWSKGDGENKKERIYINDVYSFGIEAVTLNPKGWRGISMYYDIKEDKFHWASVSSSRKQAMKDFCVFLRNQANCSSEVFV